MKTTTITSNQQELYLKLVYTHQLLIRFGGPEEAGELFEVELCLLSEILSTYFLPDTPEHEQILYDFADGNNTMDEVHQVLYRISIDHLLSSPQTTLEMLNSLKKGSDPYFALTLNGFRTNLYNMFLCETFLEDKAPNVEVANDLDLIRQKPELMEYLFFIKGSELPEEYYLYNVIADSGLRLYRKFLEMPEENEMISLTSSQLLSMSSMTGTSILLTLIHPGYNEGKEICVVCSIAKFMDLMLPDSPMDYLVERILITEIKEIDILTAEEIIMQVDEFGEIIIDATMHIHREEVDFLPDDPFIRYELRSIDLEEETPPCRYLRNRQGMGEMPPDIDV